MTAGVARSTWAAGRGGRRCAVFALLCAALALVADLPATAAQPAGRACRDVWVPVALSVAEPKNQHIYGRLCLPEGETPQTIQLLVHGITLTHEYWDFPDPVGPTHRYNYSRAANKAGFATLAIDRIGVGRSAHPPSTRVTVDSNTFTVQQVVQAINDGRITAPGGETFDNVVYVGHSYGTVIGWYLATDYGRGIAAAVFTAAFHEVPVSTLLVGASAFYPAAADPKFTGKMLDPGYLTTLPGTRYEVFYAPAKANPDVLDYSEAHKSTVTASELTGLPLALNRPLNVRVPVFLVAGRLDSNFCTENVEAFPAATSGSALGSTVDELIEPYEDRLFPRAQDVTGASLGGTDCSSAAALVADEVPHLGPNVPSVDGYVLPGGGHHLNQARNAQAYFRVVNTWVAETSGGATGKP